MSGVMQKIAQACERKHFYEAQQMYRSIVNRYAAQESFEKGILVSLDGIKTMVKYKQYALAGDLAVLVIEVFGKMNANVNTVIEASEEQKFTALGKINCAITHHIELTEHILTYLPIEDALEQRIVFLKNAIK
jgi:phosphopantetheinyl transferase (holo-ACP synthase)